jgi:hypothetical protein
MSPVIGLSLELKGQQLTFDKQEDEIIASTLGFIDKIITSANDFIRPEFAKLQFLNLQEFLLQEENEERERKLNFQVKLNQNEFEGFMMRGQEKNIYSKYMGQVKIKTSLSETKDIIFTQEEANVFNKPSVEKYMMVADPNEECYKSVKN